MKKMHSATNSMPGHWRALYGGWDVFQKLNKSDKTNNISISDKASNFTKQLNLLCDITKVVLTALRLTVGSTINFLFKYLCTTDTAILLLLVRFFRSISNRSNLLGVSFHWLQNTREFVFLFFATVFWFRVKKLKLMFYLVGLWYFHKLWRKMSQIFLICHRTYIVYKISLVQYTNKICRMSFIRSVGNFKYVLFLWFTSEVQPRSP